MCMCFARPFSGMAWQRCWKPKIISASGDQNSLARQKPRLAVCLKIAAHPYSACECAAASQLKRWPA
jgi:hypothetical protein